MDKVKSLALVYNKRELNFETDYDKTTLFSD